MNPRSSLNRRDLALAATAAAAAAAVPAIATQPLLAQETESGDSVAGHAVAQLDRRAQQRQLSDKDALPARQSALVIIDMINLFCDPKWLSRGNAESEKWLTNEFATIIPISDTCSTRFVEPMPSSCT